MALEGGQVDKAGVDESLELFVLLSAQWVSDDLESGEWWLTLFKYHESRRTDLLSLGLIEYHFQQYRMHLPTVQ